MSIPADLKYTESHEWVRTEADGTLTVGITDHAQEALGDIVFFEVQELGKTVSAGDTVAVIESVKAASDIYAPVSGEIIEANTAVADTPEAWPLSSAGMVSRLTGSLTVSTSASPMPYSSSPGSSGR